MGKLLLVRHGETLWNSEVRAQGHADVPLSEDGLRQAERLAARLVTLAIDTAFSSDLTRAQQTVQVLLGGRGVQVHALAALREQHYGEWEELTYHQAQARDPERYAQLMTGDTTFAPPGGESVQDLEARVRQVQEHLCRCALEGKNVLVVAHAGSLRALLVLILGLPLSFFWRFNLATASLSIMTVYPTGATLDLWNDTGHLEDWRGK